MGMKFTLKRTVPPFRIQDLHVVVKDGDRHATPKRWRFVRGHNKPRLMGVAIAIYFPGGININICWGLNSHCFHIIRDKLINPAVRFIYPIKGFPLESGMTIPHIQRLFGSAVALWHGQARRTGNMYEKQRMTDVFRVPFVVPAPKVPWDGWRGVEVVGFYPFITCCFL